MESLNWQQAIFGYGPAVVLLGLLIYFVLKIAPVWSQVRMRELDIRAEEGQRNEAMAAALSGLGMSLSSLADVLKSIAVEQRRSTETIEILQRVNADSNDHLSDSVKSLADRMERWERNQSAPQLVAGKEA